MKKYLPMFLACTLLGGCTKDFTIKNTASNGITTISSAELPYLFTKAISSAGINHSYYETTQNYFADIYSQYFAKSVTTERYTVNTAYTARMFLISFVQVGAQLKTIMDNVTADSPEYAMANVVWVYSFHRLTDAIGPIPYFNALQDGESTSIPYDAMDAIYADFFVRLNKAIAILESADAATAVMPSGDVIYDGNVKKWLKLANTLKLRLALRISKIDPTNAKKYAEEAVLAGVIESNADNASIEKVNTASDYNGLAQIAGWYGSSMSSTMKSYLVGYNDPRLPIYFQKNITTGTFKSRRNGMLASDLNLATNASTLQSNVGPYWITYTSASSYTQNLNARQHVMCSAEAAFLRAEGALNGWSMGGTAKVWYEKGIKLSLNQWGVVDESVITAYINSSDKPVAPEDYNNSPAVSTTAISFATSAAEQRKQIGTQKWLAIFPDGWEAWAEFRRTGYPDLYDLLASDNADLPVGTFIKRLNFPNTEYTSNAAGVASGIALLGGVDKASTRLWWDVD
ncbi:SusD/RagB family nutrient-binding outer membrane lipoprotein [Sphingobacterium multivorum]|uniref:SusD/RagB family nutrient-binding outer membrane lipoprotein n=2 Tax=Sphingobacteriaceae TaxID=84566 RepID=UPI003DA54ED6